MKQYTVFFDMHIGAPHEMIIPLEFGENVIYGGDNHEMKNILHDEVPKRMQDYKDFIYKALCGGTRTVSGNHERKLGRRYSHPYWIIDGVLFLHGDILGWSKKRYNKWRNGDLGCSKFKLFFTKIYTKFLRPKNNTLPKKYIENAIKLMDSYSCHTIVFGHRHPEKLIDIKIKGNKYRIVNCPRGKSVIVV